MEIKHIIVTTDLSRDARSAYPHAVAMASRLGAKLSLLHIDETVNFGFHNSRELVSYLELVGQRMLQRLNDEMAWFAEREIAVELIQGAGEPRRQIVHEAEARDAQMIVLARCGERGPRKHLLGSTVRQVVRHSHVPVLVVPASTQAEQPGHFPGYRQLVTSTDFSDDSRRGVRVAAALSSHFAAELRVVHVLRMPTAVPSLPGEPPLVLPHELEESLIRQQQTELDALVGELEQKHVRSHVTIGGDAAQGIVEVADSNGADLIVIPSHGKGAVRAVLFGSTSEHVLKLSNCPVLVLPRSYLEKVSSL